jgi:hypothetical protein
MSRIFLLWLGFAHRVIFAFADYFERVKHWEPLGAISLPLAVLFAVKMLLPWWVTGLLVATLVTSLIGVMGSMLILCQRPARPNEITYC